MSLFSTDECKSLLADFHRSVIHFNARSLRKNIDNITNFVASVKHSFSFICTSETWICNDDSHLYGFPSYASEYCNRSLDSHGGAAIFVSSGISYSRRLDLAIDVTHCESVWIETDLPFFPDSRKTFILGCIYRSPSSSVTEFLFSLDQILNKLSFENKDILIVGDININLLADNSNINAAYTDCFTGYGLESLITSHTRCNSHGTDSLLDHALSNVAPVPVAGVIETDISDHFPIFVAFPSEASTTQSSFYTTIFNANKFISAISSTDWSGVNLSLDPIQAFTKFRSLFLEAVSVSSTRVKCKKKYTLPNNPWMTRALLTSLRKKENLYKKTKRQPFNANLAERYKKYSSVLNKLLKVAKQRFYSNAFLKNKNNPKKQWKLLNEFLSPSSAPKTISKICSNNETYNQPSQIASAFSTYFSLPRDNRQGIYQTNLPRSSCSFFLFPVTYEEVSRTIGNLKNTSPGLDDICARHLKIAVDYICEPVSNIVNLIFNTGIFPPALKRAKIIPVYKKGDKSLVSNYRPISILSSFSKIIEKLFVKRLTEYLDKFNLLKQCQFGFRSGSSTSLALLSLTDHIKLSIDNGYLVGSVFLDFTKAFDTINHNILFSKLQSYGVTGPTLTFLQNYLLDREYVVYTNGAFSDAKIINQGVPQGSILGPLLFLLYINDLPNCLNSCHCILYADDTTIISSDKSIAGLTDKLNNELQNILNWCRNNYLDIHPGKTKYMIFKSSQRQINSLPPLTLGPNLIAVCNSVSFLGVLLDSNLKFSSHINHIKKKTAYGIRALIKARPHFPPEALLSLYFSFIHSHLNYGIAAWGNTYPCHISSAQHIQNQAIRIITRSHSQSNTHDSLCYYKVLSVNKLFQYNLSLIFFKSLCLQLPFTVINPTSLVNSNTTRFSLNRNFLLPRVHTNYGKMTSTFSAIHIWNCLPTAVKLMNGMSSFKSSLKNHLLFC